MGRPSSIIEVPHRRRRSDNGHATDSDGSGDYRRRRRSPSYDRYDRDNHRRRDRWESPEYANPRRSPMPNGGSDGLPKRFGRDGDRGGRSLPHRNGRLSESEESDEELKGLNYEEYRRLKRQKMRKMLKQCIWNVTPSPPREENEELESEDKIDEIPDKRTGEKSDSSDKERSKEKSKSESESERSRSIESDSGSESESESDDSRSRKRRKSSKRRSRRSSHSDSESEGESETISDEEDDRRRRKKSSSRRSRRRKSSRKSSKRKRSQKKSRRSGSDSDSEENESADSDSEVSRASDDNDVKLKKERKRSSRSSRSKRNKKKRRSETESGSLDSEANSDAEADTNAKTLVEEVNDSNVEALKFKEMMEAQKMPALDNEPVVGPAPLPRAEGHISYGGALRPGEGDAIAQYVQQGKRIPRRGEVGLSAEEIQKFENLGYVMSGSRHQRMNAIRIRKENQVYSAEDKRALAMFNYEEKAKREHKVMADLQRLVQRHIGQDVGPTHDPFGGKPSDGADA
ncbi:hypothetical protein L484_025082 [Morus notabilis]|uniref:NF-kappa-B-activating protein C-terminal domain-containing protein n=1 Tax=Morus notabilis TaxID=981085 RepID=W9R741_9ROSA|nr:NF-kappa-B-activating protein [Morus notabilis]XP_024017345.1 NF-kappa-B-activating protein [Morus notabilis]EXB39386.1 hypothetical protein L484_025082 [Morus notabilis]